MNEAPFERPAREPRSRLATCLIVGVVVVLVLVVLGAAFMLNALRNIGGPPLPPLQRPEAHLSRPLSIAGGGQHTLLVQAEIDASLVGAATEEGGLHMELDLEPPSEGLEVTVWQRDETGAENALVDPVSLERGADMRWSLDCAEGLACSRTLRIRLALEPGVELPDDLRWRLMLQVRIPRGTTQGELADPSLTLLEAD